MTASSGTRAGSRVTAHPTRPWPTWHQVRVVIAELQPDGYQELLEQAARLPTSMPGDPPALPDAEGSAGTRLLQLLLDAGLRDLDPLLVAVLLGRVMDGTAALDQTRDRHGAVAGAVIEGLTPPSRHLSDAGPPLAARYRAWAEQLTFAPAPLLPVAAAAALTHLHSVEACRSSDQPQVYAETVTALAALTRRHPPLDRIFARWAAPRPVPPAPRPGQDPRPAAVRTSWLRSRRMAVGLPIERLADTLALTVEIAAAVDDGRIPLRWLTGDQLIALSAVLDTSPAELLRSPTNDGLR